MLLLYTQIVSIKMLLLQLSDVAKSFCIFKSAPPTQRVKLSSAPASRNWSFGKDGSYKLCIFYKYDSYKYCFVLKHTCFFKLQCKTWG